MMSWVRIDVQQELVSKCYFRTSQTNQVWAVGVLAHHLIIGSPPFRAQKEDKLLECIRTEAVGFHDEGWSAVSESALDAVQLMLKINPRLRPTAHQMLRHPWLKLGRDPVEYSKVRSLFRNACHNLYEGQFKKLVMRVMVHHLPSSHSHVEDVIRVFRAFDKDRDGVIDASELREGFGKLPEFKQWLDDPEALFEAADRDGSGVLNLQEFAAITMPRDVICDEKLLWQVFRSFDRDGDGEITTKEVDEIVRLLEGSFLAPEQLLELCAALHVELSAVGMSSGTENEPNDFLSQFGSSRSLRANQRKVDFGEFQYLCTTRAKDRRLYKICRKELFRFVNRCWKIDLYHHKNAPLAWPPSADAHAHCSRSAYSHSGGLAERVKRQSKRRPTS